MLDGGECVKWKYTKCSILCGETEEYTNVIIKVGGNNEKNCYGFIRILDSYCYCFGVLRNNK